MLSSVLDLVRLLPPSVCPADMPQALYVPGDIALHNPLFGRHTPP